MPSATRAVREAGYAAESAADSQWAPWLGRAGLASRGVVYIVVAVLARWRKVLDD